MGKFKDLTGQKINNWKIIEFIGINKRGASEWLVECDCYKKTRNIKIVSQIKKTKTCGCNNLPDLSGLIFGRWTVLKHKEKDMWECKCSCGKETIKIIDGRRLRSGKSNSCGCIGSLEKRKNTKFYGNDFREYETYIEIILENSTDVVYIDKEDYEKIKNIHWHLSSDKYACGNINNKIVRMHRIIMDAKEKEYIDHINRNKLDNRKSNLRFANSQENSFNGSKRRNNKSGFIGVCWWERDGNWLSQIKVNYKRIFLGYYINIEDAVKARLEAELLYFGSEYAPQRHLFAEYKIGEKNNE